MANTGGSLTRGSFSDSRPRPRRSAGLGSDLSWQLAGIIPGKFVQNSRHGRLCRPRHVHPGRLCLWICRSSEPATVHARGCKLASSRLGPGPSHAALVCQHCLRGTAGWGCTSLPAVSLAWGAGVSAVACVAGSTCMHAQQSREQQGTKSLESLWATCPLLVPR